MSPEQLRAATATDGDISQVDARSDIFSFGVILYELLTGSLPFGAIPRELHWPEIRDHLLARQRARPIPLKKANPHLDEHLARIVESCLAFNARDRFQSAAELATAL